MDASGEAVTDARLRRSPAHKISPKRFSSWPFLPFSLDHSEKSGSNGSEKNHFNTKWPLFFLGKKLSSHMAH